MTQYASCYYMIRHKDTRSWLGAGLVPGPAKLWHKEWAARAAVTRVVNEHGHSRDAYEIVAVSIVEIGVVKP